MLHFDQAWDQVSNYNLSFIPNVNDIWRESGGSGHRYMESGNLYLLFKLYALNYLILYRCCSSFHSCNQNKPHQYTHLNSPPPFFLLYQYHNILAQIIARHGINYRWNWNLKF